MSKVLAQERFDSLAEKLLAMAEENGKELMGAHNIKEIKIGEKAVRFSVFLPKDQRLSYSPTILYQEVTKKPGYQGDYWAPLSETYVLRDRLDGEGSDEQLGELEAVLNTIDESIDVPVKIGG